RVWRNLLAGKNFAHAGSLLMDSDGNSITRFGITTNTTEAVSKVDPAGNTLWTTNLTMLGSQFAGELAVDKLGNTFSSTFFNGTLSIERISPDGVKDWIATRSLSLDARMTPILMADGTGGVYGLSAVSNANGLDYCLLIVASTHSFPRPLHE